MTQEPARESVLVRATLSLTATSVASARRLSRVARDRTLLRASQFHRLTLFTKSTLTTGRPTRRGSLGRTTQAARRRIQTASSPQNRTPYQLAGSVTLLRSAFPNFLFCCDAPDAYASVATLRGPLRTTIRRSSRSRRRLIPGRAMCVRS